MKDFNAIVKMFEERDYMAFCDDFQTVQKILNHCNEYVRPLHKIQYRGGNEIYIKEIITRFQKFFRTRNYIDEDNKPNGQYTEELRKITYFLILNAELPLKYDLTEDPTVCHLINIVPQLPKILLFTCIWELNLDEFLCECIAYTPTWYTVQLLDDSYDSLKYLDAFRVICFVVNVVHSIFINIARSDYRPLSIVDQKIVLSKCMDIAMGYLRHFNTPDAATFEKMKAFRRSIYQGYVLKDILSLTSKCLEIYSKKPPFELSAANQIYSLMAHKEKSCDNHSTVYSNIVQENLHCILVATLNALQQNLMEVKFESFVNWVEEVMNADDETTLQSVVGNAAYHLHQSLVGNTKLKHDVVNQLLSISVKPLSQEEMAKKATLGKIMSMLEKSSLETSIRQVWLKEFIRRGELVLDNDECLDTIENNVKFLTMENIQEILVYAAKQIDPIESKLIECLNRSLNNFDTAELKKLIQFIIELNIGDKIEEENFDQHLIEILNKSTETICTKEILQVFCQNPEKCFKKLFNEGLKNFQQMNNFIAFVNTIREISRNFFEENIKELLDDNLQSLTIEEQKLVPGFLHKIYVTRIIASDVLISKILYKTMVNALNDKNYPKILILIQSFCAINIRNDFGNLSAPVLVMAGQVLDLCRWDMLRYTEQLENIVVKSIELISDILKKLLPNATEKDKRWIFSKITSFKPITRYYFHKLGLRKEEPTINFDQFLRENRLHSDHTTFLLEIYVRCTKKEINWLAKNPQYHPYFAEVISVLAAVVAQTTVPNSVNCFRHCVQCYIRIVREYIIPLKYANEDKIALLKQLIGLLSKFQTISIYNELFMCMHTLLLDLVEETKPEIQTQRESIEASLNALADCEAKALTLQKFEVLILKR